MKLHVNCNQMNTQMQTLAKLGDPNFCRGDILEQQEPPTYRGKYFTGLR